MKKIISSLILLSLTFGLVFFNGCKEDDDPIVEFTLESLKSGNLELDGATSATNVPVDQPIIAVFANDIDESTVANSITLTRGTTDVPFTTSVSGNTLTITVTGGLLTGASYNLTIASTLESIQGAAFSSLTVTFISIGIGIDTPPQKDFQTLYLQFDGSITDLVGFNTAGFEQVTYTTDRFGKADGAASFNGSTAPGNGDIVELSGDKLITPSMTISTWFKASSADFTNSRILFGLATERGYFMELGGDAVAWMKLATSHKVSPDSSSHYFGTAWTDPNGDGLVGGQTVYDYTGSISDLVADKWSHLVMTYDATTSLKTIYIDGIKLMQVDLNLDSPEWGLTDLAIADKMDATGDPVTGIDPVLTLGYFCSRANTATGWSVYSGAENTFKGAMDDFRLFEKALTESEVQALYNSEK
ncbi:MAG: Ig-like domain-containing protein [Bacteroidales bacterium]|nr:Ig-like domain-containing protein [Bacteroidales bacterium]MCF8455572.1 Ig-like domain-containing protein [Bacteroidales bacterium]